MAFDSASLGELIVRISADARELEKGLNDAEKKVKETTKRMDVTLKGLATTSLAIGAAVAGFFALAVKTTVEYGDELFEVSQRTGVAVERLSTLKFVAEQTESSFQSLATGLKFLNRSVFDANEGNEKAVALFVKLGLATRDANGEAVKADVLFDSIADRFSKMTDQSEKTALAMQLFGRSGADLIPVLNLGSDGIEELERTARSLGLELSTENAKQIDAFSDDLKALKAEFGGIALIIGTAFMPRLREIVTFVKEGLAPTIENLNALIGTMNGSLKEANFKEAFASADPVLEDARRRLVELQEARQKLQESVDVGNTAFGGAGTPQSQADEAKLANLDIEIQRTQELLQVRREVYDETVTQQQTQAQVNEKSAQAQVSQWDMVVAKVKELNGVTNEQSSRVKAYAQELISFGNNIQASFSKALSGLISGTLSAKEAVNLLGQSLLQVLADFVAKQIIAATIGKAIQAAAVALGIASAVALGSAWAPVAAFVSLATFGANAGPAAAGITSVTSLAAGLVKALAVPALAEGGIVSSPTLALIGEAGPEAVVPLSRLGQGGSGVTIDRIEVNISGNADRNTVDYMVEQLGKKIEEERRGV